MTNQRFNELLKQIRDYAEECNDAQKIIKYLDKLMEETTKKGYLAKCIVFMIFRVRLRKKS